MPTPGKLLYLAATLAVACPCNPEPSPQPPEAPEDAGAPSCVRELAQSQCDALCSERDFIARIGSDACTPAADSGWNAEPLAVAGPLARFCRLTWQSAPDGPGPGRAPAGALRECRLSPAGEVEDQTQALRSAWREGLAFASMRSLRERLGSPPGRVRIAVIDDAGSRSTRGHGVTMAALIEEIACDPETPGGAVDCTVERVPALSRRRSSATTDDHGEYGLQSDLALAIMTAVEHWKAEPIDPKHPLRLVVNLSVGWEPACDDGAGDVVREAIAHAAAAGALVVAASGNRPPGTCVQGPMAPASWAGAPIGTDREPILLLYAATAVDETGGFLPTFRPQSAASSAALGLMAVAADRPRDPSRLLGPVSGSSVATAVVSASAALAWRYAETATAAEVMTLVRSAGIPRQDGTGTTPLAEFGALPREPQMIVSPCSTLARIAGLPAKQITVTCRAEAMSETWGRLWRDADGTVASSPGIPTSCCLGAPEPSAVFAAWVGPQPGIAACPLCGLKGARATVRVSEDFEGFKLKATHLTLWNQAGASEQHDLGNGFTTSAFAYVDNEAFRQVDGAATTRAYITMHFEDPSNAAITTAGNVVPVSR